jgi:hypothetical protein
MEIGACSFSGLKKDCFGDHYQLWLPATWLWNPASCSSSSLERVFQRNAGNSMLGGGGEGLQLLTTPKLLQLLTVQQIVCMLCWAESFSPGL